MSCIGYLLSVIITGYPPSNLRNIAHALISKLHFQGRINCYSGEIRPIKLCTGSAPTTTQETFVYWLWTNEQNFIQRHKSICMYRLPRTRRGDIRGQHRKQAQNKPKLRTVYSLLTCVFEPHLLSFYRYKNSFHAITHRDRVKLLCIGKLGPVSHSLQHYIWINLLTHDKSIYHLCSQGLNSEE